MKAHGTIISRCMVLVSLCALGGGCSGGDDEDAFVVVVESEDVVLDAVDRLELRLQPEVPSRFDDNGTRNFDDDRVETFVSSTGEFVLRAERTWVVEHRIDDIREFAVEVPLRGEGAESSAEIDDLALVASFLVGEDAIARGGARLPWPLPGGERLTVVVRCERPAFTRECANLVATGDTSERSDDTR